MARDPIHHDPKLLLDGVRRIAAGEQLDDTPTVREELIYLGLAIITYDGPLALTRQGRTLLETSPAHGRTFDVHRASASG